MNQTLRFLYKIIYILSTNYPKGNLISIIQTLFNSIGVLLISSSILPQSEQSFFFDYLHKITAFHCTKSFAIHYNTISLICFCITLFFLFILSLSIFHTKLNSSQSVHRISILILQLCSKFIYILNVFSAFLIEYYSIGIINSFKQNNFKDNQHDYFTNINKGKINSKIFISIINLINIICMIILFGFSRVVFRDHDNQRMNILNKGTIFAEIVYMYYQSIYAMIELLFVDNINKIADVKLIFTFFILFLVIIDEFLLQWKMYLRHEVSVLFRKFMNYSFLISIIIEMSIRGITFNKKQISIKKHMMNFKFFSKLILSILVVYYLYKYKQRYYKLTIITQLFQELKGKDIDTLFYFIEMIIEEKEVNENDIVDIILEHKYRCKHLKTTCPCKLFSEDCFKGKKLKNFLAIVAEHELTLKINYLYNEHADKYIDDIILMHIFFVLHIRQNKMFAFYLCAAYAFSRKQKGSFYLKYALYKIRLDIINIIDMNVRGVYIRDAFTRRGVYQIDLKGMTSTFDLNEKQTLLHPTVQMKFVFLSEKILKLLLTLANTIEEIIKYRQYDVYQYMNTGNNKTVLTFNKENKFLSETLFQKLSIMKETTEQITYNLHKYYHKFSKKINHSSYLFYPEFQFLLYHYYSLMKISPNPIESIHSSLFKNKSSLQIEGIGITNPIILTYDIKDDIYKIAYINYITVSKLKETKQSLTGKPFNTIIPYYIVKNHDLAMKIYSLNKNNLHYYTNKTFLVDKYQNLIHVNIKFTTMPSIKNVYSLIIDTQFQEINSTDPHTIYYLIISDENKILSYSHSFLKNFFLTRKILINLNITAYQLFGIDFASECGSFNKMDYNEMNNALTAFKKVDDFMIRDYTKLESFSDKKFVYKEVILTKEQFIKNLNKIEHHIIDLTVDVEYLMRIQSLKQRMMINNGKKGINGKDWIFKFKYSKRMLGDMEYVIVQIEENEVVEVIERNIKNIRFKCKGLVNFNDDEETKNSLILQPKQNYLLNKLQFSHEENDISRSSNHNNILNKGKESLNVSPIPSPTSTFMNQTNSTLMINSNNQSNSTIVLMSNNRTSPRYKLNKTRTETQNFKYDTIDYGYLEQYVKKYSSNALKIKSIFLLSHHIYLIIVISLLIGLFLLNLYNIIFNTATLNNSQIISQINFNAILLKGDIIDLGIYYIVLCLLTDNLTPKSSIVSEDNYREITNFRTSNILNRLQKVTVRTNQINSVKGIDKVFGYLSYENTYLTESLNGYIIERKSTFSEELRQIYYYAVAITHKEKLDYCNLIEHIDPEQSPNGHTITSEETFLFYCLNNILSKLEWNCLNLSIETENILLDYHNTAKKKFLFTNIVILLLIFCLYSLIVISIFKDNNQISSFIIAFLMQEYHKEIRINEASKRIALYKQCISNFSYENIRSYIIASSSDNIPKNNRSCSKKMSISLDTKGRKREKGKQYERYKEIEKEKNTYLIMNSRLFTPVFLKYSLMLMIIMFISLSVFQIFSIVYMNISYNTLLFINQIAVNFIERFPLILEILYYYMNSILLDDPYFLPTSQKDEYKIHLTSNYYNVSYDLSRDKIFEILGDSGYAYLYYCYIINRDNINMFVNDKSKSKSLSETVKFTQLIESGNDLPIEVAIYYNRFYGKECRKDKHNFQIEKCFEEITNTTKTYILSNRKMINESAIILMNSMIEDLNHMYIDYVTGKGKVDRLDLLIRSNILVTVDTIMSIFYNMHLVYTNLLKEDIDGNYMYYRGIEISLSLLSILSNFILFIVTFLYVVNRVRVYVSLLKHEGRTVYAVLTKERVKEDYQHLKSIMNEDDVHNELLDEYNKKINMHI